MDDDGSPVSPIWPLPQLDVTLDNIREGFQILSPEWRYLYVNDAVCRHGRQTREALLGHTMMEVYPGIDETPMFEVLERCMRERSTAEIENEFTYPDGSKGWFELRIQPVPAGLLILSLDIGSRKLLEAQLVASQRMEAVGRLAGGVAHDFNNILTAIVGFGEFALGALQADHPAKADVREILAAAQRAGTLVAQLLAFSRQRPMEPRVIAVNEQVRGLDAMLRRVLGRDIELVTVLGEGVGRVRIDPSALEQVLVNLVVNARDAMPGGGRLVIETSNAELDESYQMAKGVPVSPGSYVAIVVTDSGEGMDAATLSRIFEPFFTTKELRRGTGLGLSTCYGIVDQAGGYIWVYSEPERGTTFKIYFPRVDLPLSPPVVQAERTPTRGTETVLVVDDEPQIRAVVVRILEECGYRVLSAAAPAEALARSGDEEIHLLLTDVVMPGMSGRVLAERLRERHPGMRVLFMSGYTENVIVHHGVLDSGVRLLQKPFVPEVLLAEVRAALDGE